jgi:1-deoxy-D-xylulose-5-phosphate synthase
MTRLLDTISTPRDLRQLPLEKLTVLAREVRQHLQRHSTLRDGYRASAIGLAELTIALHFVYDFSHDKLVFDMAHQCAAHTVLTRTGRDGAETGGSLLAGVGAGRRDSSYDQFIAAHAGTSIATALGMASAQDDGAKTVAVIGDGAIVSGIALESLNSGGPLDRDVLVVLNDNEMSISKVVGALGEYLAKLRVGKTYNELKRDAHKLVQSIPIIGERLDKAAEQLKDAVAKALVPGHMFESLGPRYFGPVDGHKIPHLVNLLRDIRRQRGFFLLHVVTRRDDPAPKASAVRERPAPKAQKSEPEALTTELEFRRQGEEPYINAFASALRSAAERDPSVAVVLAAAPETQTSRAIREQFSAELASRLWDVDICEQHGMAFAAGLARSGRRAVVIIPSTFLQRAYDQVFQEVVLNRLPVTLGVTMAGFVDDIATSHHGLYDVAYLRALPGVDLLAPRDARELRRMLDWALTLDRPAALRVPQTFAPHEDLLFDEHAELAAGKAEVLRRGSDIVLWALGSMVYPAMEAADLLAAKGLEATVINARFARPIDVELLGRVIAEHTLTFALEEHSVNGGLGGAVLEAAARERLGAAKVMAIGAADAIWGPGARTKLLRQCGLDPTSLADRILLDYRRHVRSPARG